MQWTYSRLDSFESCPKKFYHLNVVKDFKDPPNEHSEWGTRVHTAFEDAVNKGTPLPDGMAQWQTLANKVAAISGDKLTEHRFAIDKNFKPVDWKDGWSRGIADLVILRGDKAAVLDYKTGKRKPSEQLLLYANYVYHHFPKVKEVRVGYVWLKDKRIDWTPTKESTVAETWQTLMPRVRKLESAYERDSWPPKPSGLCRGWCPITTCEFNRGKK